jgi:manganese-transporting P-type ATPase
MRPEPPPVYVCRGGAWSVQPAAVLIPGDIISLCATSPVVPSGVSGAPTAAAAAVVPGLVAADCVLVRGSVVVNEAMLTGESAPLMKEALPEEGQGDDDDAPSAASGAGGRAGATAPRLNAFLPYGHHTHAKHAVFAGTTILQASASGNEGGGGGADDGDGAVAAAVKRAAADLGIPVPPDGGAVAVVARTGFGTSQGDLMRTITHVNTRATAANWEAFVFIAGEARGRGGGGGGV